MFSNDIICINNNNNNNFYVVFFTGVCLNSNCYYYDQTIDGGFFDLICNHKDDVYLFSNSLEKGHKCCLCVIGLGQTHF